MNGPSPVSDGAAGKNALADQYLPNRRSGAAGPGLTSIPRNHHLYHAFISYSHQGERDLARSLEKTLWTFGRSWYKVRGIRTYRDETNLAAEPDMWPKIETAVRRSGCLVLLASPDSASSKWVPREVIAAVNAHGITCLCIVRTAGVLPWTDGIAPESMFQRPDGALCASVWQLLDEFQVEPLVVDLRPFRSIPERQRLRNSEYLSRVAGIAAKVLEKDKETIWGDYYRAQRRRGLFLGAVSFVLFGLIVALVFLLDSEQQAARKLAQTLSRSEFRNGIASLEANDVPRAIGHFIVALRADPTYSSAADRLFTLITQRPRPWLLMRKFEFDAEIVASALSPDGRLIAIALPGGKVSLHDWDGSPHVLGGDLAPALGNETKIYLAFADGGNLLVAVRQDGTLQVWGTDTGNLVRRWVNLGEPSSLAVSPDSRWVAVGREDGRAVVVALGKGQERIDLAERAIPDGGGNSSPVSRITFVGNQEKVILFKADRAVQWEFLKAKVTNLLAPPSLDDESNYGPYVSDFDVSSDGLWNLRVMRDPGDFQAVQLPRDWLEVTKVGATSATSDSWKGPQYLDNVKVEKAVFDPTSSHLALTLNNGAVLILNRGGNSTTVHHNRVQWAGFDKEGKVAYTVSDSETHLWSVPDGAEIVRPIPRGGLEGTITVLRGARHWFTVVIDTRSISLWSAAIVPSSVPTESLNPAQAEHDWKKRFKRTHDGRRLEMVEKGTWTVVDASDSNKQLPRFIFPLSDEAQTLIDEQNERFTEKNIYPMTDAAIDGNGTVVVTVAGERAPAVWKVGEELPIRSLGEDGKKYAESVVLDREGTRALIMFSGDSPNQVDPSYAVFALRDGHRVAEWNFPPSEAPLDISHDCRRMIVRQNLTVVVLDVDDRHIIGFPVEQKGQICGAAFSEDGRTYVTVTTDGIIRVWDVETGVPLSEDLISGAKSGEDGCVPVPWFSHQDRRVNIVILQQPESSEPEKLLTWELRSPTREEEVLQLAELSLRCFGVQGLRAGMLESVPLQTVAALRQQFLANPDSDIGRLASKLLSDALPVPTHR